MLLRALARPLARPLVRTGNLTLPVKRASEHTSRSEPILTSEPASEWASGHGAIAGAPPTRPHSVGATANVCAGRGIYFHS